jgi:Holliday junction resolvase RusA-like endonuclease
MESSNTTTFKSIEYSFVVNMEPRPLMRHMSRGGFMYNPSAPLQKKFLSDCQPFLPSTPLDGPLELELYFHFRRPLSHFRTGQYKHILKESSPLYHTGKRDIDNLIKFVLDALNKVAYSDDAQVCMLKSGKYYTSDEPRVEVIIRSLDPDHR